MNHNNRKLGLECFNPKGERVVFEDPQPEDTVAGYAGATCTVAEFNAMSEESRQAFAKGKQMITVNAIRCPKCGDTIYSRCRHDFRGCTCGSIAIDGGRDYMKVSCAPEFFSQIKYAQLELEVTDMELYQDWNSGSNLYGKLNIPMPVNKGI